MLTIAHILPVVPFPIALSKSPATATVTNTCNERHVNYGEISGIACRKDMVNDICEYVLR